LTWIRPDTDSSRREHRILVAEKSDWIVKARVRSKEVFGILFDVESESIVSFPASCGQGEGCAIVRFVPMPIVAMPTNYCSIFTVSIGVYAHSNSLGNHTETEN
jgi:hypothetical protein